MDNKKYKKNKCIAASMLIVIGFVLSSDYIWNLIKIMPNSAVFLPVFPALQFSGAIFFMFVLLVVTDDKKEIDDFLEKHYNIKHFLCFLLDKCYQFVQFIKLKFFYLLDIPSSSTNEEENPTYLMKALTFIFLVIVVSVLIILILKYFFKINACIVDCTFDTMTFLVNSTNVTFIIYKIWRNSYDK